MTNKMHSCESSSCSEMLHNYLLNLRSESVSSIDDSTELLWREGVGERGREGREGGRKGGR